MLRQFRNVTVKSLKVKLIFGVLVLTVPLIAALIYNNMYAIKVVRNQVADSYKNMLSLYMNQIDSGLGDVDQYISGMVGFNMLLFDLESADTEEDYYRAKIMLYNQLKQDLTLFKTINTFFVYAPEREDFMEVQHVVDEYEESERIHRYLKESALSLPDNGGFEMRSWKAHLIGDDYYVIHMVKSGSVYFGAWEKADRLKVSLSLIHLGERGGSLFASDAGEAMTNHELIAEGDIHLDLEKTGYTLSGQHEQFLIVGEPSARGDFSLVAVIPDEQILENLPYFQQLVSLIPLAAVIIIPLGLYFLRQIVLLPINRLVMAMKRIREGNLGVRIETSPSSEEFVMVNQTFNTMMEQIQELRIHIYEEQLGKQREELQRLQLQINPHFFLNALNIIYHLAKVKDYELIKEMSQSLIRYFRFMFRSDMAFVRLEDEVEHTRNYLRIQELRFPGKLSCTIAVPDYVLHEHVPPLIIQTFAENTIKHAVTLDEAIVLKIEADIVEDNEKPCLKISISDTGVGFSAEVLEQLGSESRLINDQGEQIGVWNVYRRLRLLYAGQAKLSFHNAGQGGAVVTIVLPLQQETED